MPTMDLSNEISAFLTQRARLAAELGPQWVVFVDGKCQGHFDAFDEAARYALEHHRSRRFLIRHTSDQQPVIPLMTVEE